MYVFVTNSSLILELSVSLNLFFILHVIYSGIFRAYFIIIVVLNKIVNFLMKLY